MKTLYRFAYLTLFAFLVGYSIATLLSSCSRPIVPTDYQTSFGGVISEVYEDNDGLVVIMPDKSEILIELEDEVATYNFATQGKEYQIHYFRKGNETVPGVFVVFQDELYQIDSPFKHLKK